MRRRIRAVAALAFSAAPRATAGMLALAVAEGVLPAVAAWSLKVVLDELARGDAAVPGRVAAGAVGLAAAGMLLGIRQSVDAYVTAYLRRAIQLAVQDRLFRRVNADVGLARFEDPGRIDRLRLAEEAGERTPEELVGAAVTLVRATVSTVCLLAILFVIWPPVVLLLLVAGAPTVVLQASLSRRRAALTEDIMPLIRRQTFFNRMLTEARAAKEVRLFGLGSWLHGRLLGQLRAAHAAEAAMATRALRVEAALDLVGAAVTVAGTAIAAYQAMRGLLTIGDVSVFLTGVGSAYVAIGGAASAAALAYQGLLLFGHYQDVIDEPNLPGGTGERAAAPLQQGIELRDVWFRYRDGEPWALRGVDLTIPAGATVGLVGRNGAGKSTIVKLLTRMYEPASGSIRWDGVDIREIDPAVLRARIGAVFQDFMEYDLTAAENIGVGRLPALDDLGAIRAAARTAGVDDALAELPAGYRTLLSRMFDPDCDDDAAGLLSGGQWQRVALARAFLRHDADLMILDEPSAGLDAEAEAEVHSGLRQLRVGRTSLLISHRLSTLRDADVIHVLDRGRIVESGRHDELLAGGRTYARLFALQAAGYREEPAKASVTVNGYRPTA
ncbi:MAG TPA: ABC transporter ATP-binding protein [Micromonosporaceae bacterium]|nr:ABC transporter ATP-binding protein [Micromonosporaceae bacterium]